MHSVIDLATNVGKYADQLVAAGVKTVIRYYNHRNSSRLPNKGLTQPELDLLLQAGLSVAVVFQQRGGAGGELGDLSADAGRRDAARALALAQSFAQPAGSAIYFSVDHDYYRSGELAQIEGYFREVAAALSGRYRVGVYGSGTVGRRLKGLGLVELIWLAGAAKWSGTQDVLAEGSWALFQKYLDQTAEVGSFDHDGNLVNPAHGDFGQFAASGPVETPKGVGTAALFEVTARHGLHLRSGPGEHHQILKTLQTGDHLEGVARDGNWMTVDLEGDGLVDGYVFTEFVQAVSGGLPLKGTAGQRPIDVARAELVLDIKEVAGAANNPRIVMYHATTIGGSAPDETAWCSSFVNYCVEQAGLSGTDSKWARSWHDDDWGVDVTAHPAEGDIVVWRRQGAGDDGGHVGFFLSQDNGTIEVLGGNQSNRLRIARFPKQGLVAPYTYTLLSIRRG